jgi:hypothetical protein
MTTRISIAGHECDADSYEYDPDGHRWTTWIATGPWLEDTITQRVTQLIDERRAARANAGLPVRGVVDAAMRVQLEITDYFRVEQISYHEGSVSCLGRGDEIIDLAGAVERLLSALPEIVLAAVLP